MRGRFFPISVTDLILILGMALHGCQRASYFSPPSGLRSPFPGVELASGGGTANPFEGQVARYVHIDPSNRCPDGGVNDEVDIASSSGVLTPRLTRSGCVALDPPLALSISDLQFATDGSGDLTYQGKQFVPAPPTLALDFTTSASLNPGIAFSRGSAASYFDSAGKLVSAPAGAPRFDYNPVTHQLNGLLMESSATNLAPYSADAAKWDNNYATVTTDIATAPDGSFTADLISDNDTANMARVYPVAPATDGLTYTGSIFIKAGTSSWVDVSLEYWDGTTDGSYEIGFDPNTGTYVLCNGPSTATVYVQNVGGGWWRVSISGKNIDGGTTYAFYDVYPARFPSGTCAEDRSLRGTVYVWGAQIELGSSPTSYIPTTAATVTRSADTAQFTGMSWYNPAAGTLFAEYVDLGSENSAPAPAFGLFNSNDGAFARDSIVLSDQGSTDTSSVTSGGSSVFAPGGGLNPTGAVNRQALAYSAGGFFYSGNGAAVVAASGGTLPATAAYSYLGSQPDGKMRDRYIRRVEFYNDRLPDATLQELTR